MVRCPKMVVRSWNPAVVVVVVVAVVVVVVVIMAMVMVKLAVCLCMGALVKRRVEATVHFTYLLRH